MMLPYDCFVGAREVVAGCCPTSEQDCLVGHRDLCDSGAAAGGFSCHSGRSRRVDSFVPALLLSDIRLDCDSSSHIIPTPTNTRHGFTGHEHLDKFALINMNGRVYDPVIGQFLSPDPFVQSATSPQSYNRYSYCWNNPLKYTDPSGYVTIDIDGLTFNTNSRFLSNSIVGHNMANMTSISTSSGFNLSWGDVVRLKNFGCESTYRHGKSGYWVNNNYWDSGPNWTGTKTVLPDVILKELRMRALNVTSTFVESEKLTAALEYIQYGPFSSRIMRQSWENNRDNPMRDVGMIHVGGTYAGPTPWMRDFNRAFGTMLNVGMAAGLAPIIAPTLFEHVSTKFLINGFLSSSVNAIGQYTLTGDVDLVDVGAAFVFNKPFGNSLFAYSFTAGLFDYSITNQTLRSPFLGNKDGLISAVEIICNLYMGGIGGQASKFSSNNFTKFGINTGFTGLGIYLFSNYSK